MADIVTLFFKITAQTGDARRELTSLGRTIADLGRNFQQVGATLSVSVTAPILALSAASAQSAINLDKQVNLLKAFTGSAEAAEKRLAQLIETAKRTPGLTVNLAALLDAQARVAGAAETSINKLLPVIGRLNAVSTLGDPQRFVQNLIQLITQNFERADLKELVGQSPIAGELIKQLFNVDSPINSEAIRASAERLGIRTMDSFFTALADAAAKNPKLAAVTDSIASQIEKMVDRVSVALRPLGLAIIQNVTPIVEALVPIVEKLGAAFASLPGPVQTTVIVLGAVAAAAGPLLFVLGGAAQAVVAFAEAWAILQTAMAAGGVLAALPALLNPATLAIAALAAVLGAAALAWATYEDAADRAAKLSVQQITAQQTEIDQLRELQARAEALATSQGASAQKHAELQAILARLDPDTRAYIETISDENAAVVELNRVLKDQIALKGADLAKNLSDIGDAMIELQERTTSLQRRLEFLRFATDEFARTQNETILQQATEFLGQAVLNERELGAVLNQTRRDIGATQRAYENFGAQIAAYLEVSRLNTAEFAEQQLALGRTRAQVDVMVAAYNAFTKSQEEAAARAKNTTTFIDQQRAAIDALVNSLDKLNKNANDQVDKQIRQIALTSRNAAEAKARVQEALKLDDDFFFAVKERQRVAKNLEAAEGVIDPKSRAGKVAAEQRATASAELKLLQQIEREREIATRRETEALQRSFDDRLISIRDYTERAIALDQELLRAKLATLKEEEVVAIRASKNKADADAKVGEIKLRAEQARLDSELRQEELRRQRRDAEIRAEQEHQRRLEEIREIGRRSTEEAIRQALSRGAIGAIEAEERLIEIERERFDAKKARLEEEFILAGANLQEQRRINDELAILAAQRAAFEEQAARRIQAAQATLMEKLREFLRERRRIIEETAAAQVELLRQEADDARRRAELTADPRLQREAIQIQLRAEEAAADLRHRLNLQRIEQDRITAIEAANNNAALIEQVERASNERRLAEEARFQNEKRAIREQAAIETAATDPLSNQSLFGITDESVSRITAAGQTIVNVLAQIGASGKNMGQILSEAFNKVLAGAGAMLQSFILTGQTGPAAFKKLAAGIIASIASEAFVQALRETAAGFAALARGNPGEAALHFKSAAIWGTTAAAAGGIAAAISGGGGAGAGAGAGGGSQSAGAFGSEQRDLRVQRGGAAGPGEQVIEGNPMFAAITDLRNTVKELSNRIGSMPPEEVLTVGASRRPDIIGEAAIRETRRNSEFVNTLGTSLGVT